MSGLSQSERLKRITNIVYPKVVEDNPEKLLVDFLRIASFIKMYGIGSREGSKEQFFYDLFTSTETNLLRIFKEKKWNGNLDPSSTLVISFIENLSRTANIFNERWKELPNYYFSEILGIKPNSIIPDIVWISIENIAKESIFLAKGSRFKVKRGDNISIYQSLKEVEIGRGRVEKIFNVDDHQSNSETHENHFQVTELIADKDGFFITKNVEATVGMRISSPVLFLKEGRRNVEVVLYLKSADIDSKKNHNNTDNDTWQSDVSELFSLNISTNLGWETVVSKSIEKNTKLGAIVFSFSVPESFSPIVACSKDIHGFNTVYPVLNIIVNLNSSEHRSISLVHASVTKVEISATVENLGYVQIYNELGRLDNSKPFMPFGINANKGSWFIIGNYEMNIKNTKEVSINLFWDELISDGKDLKSYYKEYNSGIDESSFKVGVKYLLDYEWKLPEEGKGQFDLFKTDEVTKSLLNHSQIDNVNIDKMVTTTVSEDDYVYSMQSREGFIQIVLEEPTIGFGLEQYREIFSKQLLKKSRKGYLPTIKPPIQPILNRVTLDYYAIDTIEYGMSTEDNHSFFVPIVPLDNFANQRSIYNKDVSLIPDLEGKNTIFAFNNITPGTYISLLFELMPFESANLDSNSIYEQRGSLKKVNIFIGNPLYWKKAPPSLISRDETMGLLINGALILHFPEYIEPELYDSEGLLWIRINYKVSDKIFLPEIQAVYSNVVKLELIPSTNDTADVINTYDGEIEEDTIVAGVGKISRITPFYGGRAKEKEEDVFLRVSEYNRHRGRAVTKKDYEELVLQRFLEVDKVKCFKKRNPHTSESILYLVIVPNSDNKRLKYPLASPFLLFEVESYIRQLTSSYVNNLRVVNPVYEEILIKCKITLTGYFSARNRKKVIQIINNRIAPWIDAKQSPYFDYEFCLKEIYDELIQEFGQLLTIDDLMGVQFCKHNQEVIVREIACLSNKKWLGSGRIRTSEANAVLVPYAEHLINWGEDYLSTYGIKEMSIGDNFIINN